MAIKKVLVTGATGFIGRRLLPLLVGAGYDVVALSRKPQQASPGIRYVAVDLLAADAIDSLIAAEQPEALVHLAWCTEHGAFWESADNHQWVDMTLRMAKIFANNGGEHFVGAGSCAEYAWDSAAPLAEDDAIGEPDTLYGQSKKLVCRQLTELFADTPVCFDWGRIFFIYGYGEGESKFISSAIDAYGRGDQFGCQNPLLVRDFIYVDDVANAFSKMLATASGAVYNVGSGTGNALGDVVALIADAFEFQAPLFPETGEKVGMPVVADVDRATKLLGFAPSFTLKMGIQAHMHDQVKH